MAENIIDRLNKAERDIERLNTMIIGDRELQSRGISNGAMQRIDDLAAIVGQIRREISEGNASTAAKIDALRGELEGQATADTQRQHALIALVALTFMMSLSALAALWIARL